VCQDSLCDNVNQGFPGKCAPRSLVSIPQYNCLDNNCGEWGINNYEYSVYVGNICPPTPEPNLLDP